MRGRTMIAGAATLLAATAAGCGGGGGAESAAKDFYKAGANGDGGKVCDLLASKPKAEFTKALAAAGQKGSCSSQLDKILKENSSDSDRKEIEKAVEDGKIKTTEKGDTATVKITYKGDTQSLKLVKEDGDWKVDQSLTGS